jgi:MFS family permease
MLACQALIIFSLLYISQDSAILIVFAATWIGFNYGTNLSLFPSLTKDYFGLKNFGGNYGLVFTAWGIGGFIFPRLAQMLAARSGSLDMAYMLTAGMLLLGAVMAISSRKPVDDTGHILPGLIEKASAGLQRTSVATVRTAGSEIKE